jgi:hypothetical protein
MIGEPQKGGPMASQTQQPWDASVFFWCVDIPHQDYDKLFVSICHLWHVFNEFLANKHVVSHPTRAKSPLVPSHFT